MSARIRIPQGQQLIEAIERVKGRNESPFGVTEHHVGKTWVPVNWNPAGVLVIGHRP